MIHSNREDLDLALDPKDRAALDHLAIRLGFDQGEWAEVSPLRKVAELVTTSAIAGQLSLGPRAFRRGRAFLEAAASIGADWETLQKRYSNWKRKVVAAKPTKVPVPSSAPEQFLS